MPGVASGLTGTRIFPTFFTMCPALRHHFRGIPATLNVKDRAMKYTLVLFLLLCALPCAAVPQSIHPAWIDASIAKLEKQYSQTLKAADQARLRRGLRQLADFWRAEDGDAAAFEGFVAANFSSDQPALDTLFTRFEHLMEQIAGHMHEIGREFRNQSDLDLGPILPYDEVFAAYDPSAHITDDFFQNKLAFVTLLNFPVTTLKERLSEGDRWSRRAWAETRLAESFSKRIPAEVNLAIAQAAAESDQYIAQYNIWMHHLLDEHGERLFPAKLRLLSHWNLRDEIKADYGDPRAIEKQRMIQKVMERIVDQTIPAIVVNNPNVDWNPTTNEVKPTSDYDGDGPATVLKEVSNAPEGDARYAVLQRTFFAEKKADPYSPTAPTHIARRFDEDRQIPEARVEAILKEVLGSPLVPRVASLIAARLGRPLEPFDVWYNGFKERGAYTEQELDKIVAAKYPTAAAYKADIPRMLRDLGFSPEKADAVAGNIIVDPARGSGHASGAEMRSEKAHLRTRVAKGGMNYKGYNIAVHEMGHNVEQTFSLNAIDHFMLHGVPNTAFTEALAFVFQGHDLELLGLTKPDAKSEAMKTLNDFWGTYEIAGVALVDMGIWHWMYDHPAATPAEVRDATRKIARDIWNTYYAPVFNRKDVELLAIYSHMIHSFLYLPDYPLGHLIAFQIEETMRKAGSIGGEFERMATYGRLTPDQWMIHATGAPVGAGALLGATERALGEFKSGGK